MNLGVDCGRPKVAPTAGRSADDLRRRWPEIVSLPFCSDPSGGELCEDRAVQRLDAGHDCRRITDGRVLEQDEQRVRIDGLQLRLRLRGEHRVQWGSAVTAREDALHGGNDSGVERRHGGIEIDVRRLMRRGCLQQTLRGLCVLQVLSLRIRAEAVRAGLAILTVEDDQRNVASGKKEIEGRQGMA